MIEAQRMAYASCTSCLGLVTPVHTREIPLIYTLTHPEAA